MLMMNRAEDLCVNAKDTINMTERLEWSEWLGRLCAAATAEAKSKGGKSSSPPTLKQLQALEKVVAHMMRFPNLGDQQHLLMLLAQHAPEEL